MHALYKPLTIFITHSAYYHDKAGKLIMSTTAGANYFVKLGIFQRVEEWQSKQGMLSCYYYYYYFTIIIDIIII